MYLYLISVSGIFFILGSYFFPTHFLLAQVFLAISSGIFVLYFVKTFRKKNFIRYECINCKEKCIGGPENKTCPLCGGTLVFKEVVDRD